MECGINWPKNWSSEFLQHQLEKIWMNIFLVMTYLLNFICLCFVAKRKKLGDSM